MNTSFTRTGLALAGALVWLTTSVQAADLRFSDLEARLANIEARLAAQEGVQTASYVDANGNAVAGGCGDACCGDACCGDVCGDCCDPCCGSWYAEVHLQFLRAHLFEDALGKLSERYELSPRFVIGYENGCGQGGRVRYWHYGYLTTEVDDAGGARFETDIFDAEVTSRFKGRRSDVVLAGGFRGGNFEIVQGGNAIDIDVLGLTMAADARTLICCDCNAEWNWVYGGRLAILGGDWEGTSNSLVDEFRDDNIVVHELYVGVEYGCCHCGYDVYSRLAFEMQNWHSDNLAQNSGGADTIGFVGPAVHIGVGF